MRHRELVVLARSAMVIVDADNTGELTDRIHYVSYPHVASIETLAPTA